MSDSPEAEPQALRAKLEALIADPNVSNGGLAKLLAWAEKIAGNPTVQKVIEAVIAALLTPKAS